jgi:hypothetical protein
MTTLRERLIKWGSTNPHVIDRIVRLNPNPKEGEMLRGWHPARHVGRMWHRDVIGKGAFIRKYGRIEYELLPEQAIIKDGKRVYIMRQYAL